MKIHKKPLFYPFFGGVCLLALIVILWVRGDLTVHRDVSPQPMLGEDDVKAITVIEPGGTRVIYSKGKRSNGRLYWYPTKVIPPISTKDVKK